MNDRPVIVSLDWDWVVGDTNDGPSCCGFCEMPLSSYRKRGIKKNMITDWSDRFEELKVLPIPVGSQVVVAECHGSIGEVFLKYSTPIVVDYDAHCDRYNNGVMIDCANWINHLEKHGGKYLNCYEWDWHGKRMDAVFLCRSAPWTPEELDDRFYELVWHLCFHAQTEPKFIGHMKKSMRKIYIERFGVESIAI